MSPSRENSGRGGCDGHTRRKGSQVHLAVDSPGRLLTIKVTPANEKNMAQVNELVMQIQEATGNTVENASADQGHNGHNPAAEAHGTHLEVVKLPTAKPGFVLAPRRWVVERSYSQMARSCCWVRDYERLTETLVGLHVATFATLMAQWLVKFMALSA